IEEEVVDRWWQSEAWNNPEIQADLGKVMETVGVSDIKTWMSAVCKEPWIANEIESLAQVEPSEQLQALAAIESLATVLPATPKAGRLAEEMLKLTGEVRAGNPAGWQSLTQLVREEKGYLFLNGSGIPEGVNESIRSLPLDHLRFFESYYSLYSITLRSTLSGVFSTAWSSWIRLLKSFSSWSTHASIRLLGLVSFDDMIKLSVQMLRDHPEVRLLESRRLGALLVDEFQDTDPLQLELLRNLLLRPEGSFHEVLGFFVGDIKQSIYRFRGTDVPSIERFSDEFQTRSNCRMQVRHFVLKTTFRNTQSICSFVNDFFSSSFQLANESQQLIPYRKSESPKPRWIIVKPESAKDKPSAEEVRKALADTTVNLITEYLEGVNATEPPYRDILVLTRNKRELDTLLTAAQEAGLPVLSTGARTFYRHQEVLDVLNLLICLHNPHDSVSTAALLRSHIIGLRDDEIHRLLSTMRPRRIVFSKDSLPDFLPQSVLARIEILRKLAATRHDRILADWLQEAALLIPKAHYTPETDVEGRTVARMAKVLSDFEKVCSQGMLPPLVWLLKQRNRASIADSWNAELGEDVSIFDESIEAVRIMTVHKAKGLEAKHVILYGWTPILSDALAPKRRSSPETLEVTESDGTAVKALSLKWGPLAVATPTYEEALKIEEAQEMEEACRLAYVAATRARDQLVILTPPPVLLPQEINEYLEAERAKGSTSPLEICEYKPLLRQLIPPSPPALELNASRYLDLWQSRYAALSKSSDKALFRPTDKAPTSALDTRRLRKFRPEGVEFGLKVGDLTHAYLERHEGGHKLDESVLLTLASRGVQGAVDPELLKRVRTILLAFLGGESADEVGQPYCERLQTGLILGREVPFYVYLNDRTWHGVIDLVLDEGSWICAVDYKTGTKPQSLPPSYETQKSVYVSALRQLFPNRDIKFEFWWLES
ncbi:MAG TPA: 3'-5' exonuclease, partial [Acidobacteriota bacterium]|nr:3'-5' exonuclease [Acidobacteriota bacterium]